MNKFKITFLVLMIVMMIIPVFSQAQYYTEEEGLVPCGKGTVDSSTNKISDECDWNGLMSLVNRVINFIFVVLAVPICALMFAYAGFLMVSAGGESASAKTKAKEIFFNTVVGFLFIATSWLIIHIILNELGFRGSWIGF